MWLQKTQIGGCGGLLLFVVITYTIKIIRTPHSSNFKKITVLS
ncbi:hypothetical protein EVA_15843 [gut metagenome]|uniref:Uncharacterized protein n=1 Tax=gut metagenome TaxID=749906 RepID=J9C881_9ZZZZ